MSTTPTSQNRPIYPSSSVSLSPPRFRRSGHRKRISLASFLILSAHLRNKMAQRMQGGYPPQQQDQYGAPGGGYGNQDPYGQQQQQYGGQEQQFGGQEQQHGGHFGGQQRGGHQQPGQGEEREFGNPQEQQQHQGDLGGAQHPGHPGGNSDEKALSQKSGFVHPHDELADDEHHNMMMDAMHEMSRESDKFLQHRNRY